MAHDFFGFHFTLVICHDVLDKLVLTTHFFFHIIIAVIIVVILIIIFQARQFCSSISKLCPTVHFSEMGWSWSEPRSHSASRIITSEMLPEVSFNLTTIDKLRFNFFSNTSSIYSRLIRISWILADQMCYQNRQSLAIANNRLGLRQKQPS